MECLEGLGVAGLTHRANDNVPSLQRTTANAWPRSVLTPVRKKVLPTLVVIVCSMAARPSRVTVRPLADSGKQARFIHRSNDPSGTDPAADPWRGWRRERRGAAGQTA